MKHLLIAGLALLPLPALASPPNSEIMAIYANFGAYQMGTLFFKKGETRNGCMAAAHAIFIAEQAGLDSRFDRKLFNRYCAGLI